MAFSLALNIKEALKHALATKLQSTGYMQEWMLFYSLKNIIYARTHTRTHARAHTHTQIKKNVLHVIQMYSCLIKGTVTMSKNACFLNRIMKQDHKSTS